MPAFRSILFVTYHFPPDIGGIETRIIRYIDNLSKKGIRVTIIVLTRSQRPRREYLLGSAKVFVCPGKMSHFPKNFTRLIKTISTERIQVIHVFSGATTLFSVATLLVARIMRMPSVFSFFGREGVTFPSPIQTITFYLSAMISTSIATNTSAMKSLIPKRFQTKTHLLFGGAETVPRREEFMVSDPKMDSKVILYVGRLTVAKGVDDLVEASFT